MLKIEAPDRRWTYADYKDWELKPGERYEIIDGVAYAMSAPNLFHQSMLMELAKQIAVFLTGKPCKVFPAPSTCGFSTKRTKATARWYSLTSR